MRARKFSRYESTSYTAVALLARHGLLKFARVKRVQREGREVVRMVDWTFPVLPAKEQGIPPI